MVGTINVECNASNPNIALRTVYSFIGSPSNIRVLNVPKKIGDWKISKVYIACQYPDNSIQSIETKLVGGVYVGTIQGSSVSGKTENGFTITASGTDESGNAVSGYVLGKGDVVVLNQDSTITVGGVTYYLHLLDSIPTTPHKGDVAVIDGTVKLYTGTEWVTFGGESYWNITDGQLSPNADVSSVFISAYTIIDDLSSASIPTKTSELENDSGFATQNDMLWKTCDGVLMPKCSSNAVFINADNSIDMQTCNHGIEMNDACGRVIINSFGTSIKLDNNAAYAEANDIVLNANNCVKIEADSQLGQIQITNGYSRINLYNYDNSNGLEIESGGVNGIALNAVKLNLNSPNVKINDDEVVVSSDLSGYMKKVNGTANNVVLFDSLGKIKDSNTALSSLATNACVSNGYVKKVNGTDGNVVLFDQSGKIKDSNTALSSLATKDDLDYDKSNVCVTESSPCIDAHSGEFVDVVEIEPCIDVYVYLGDSACDKVSDAIIQFDYSALTAETQLPQIYWYLTDNVGTIAWQHVEVDEVEAGKQYLYMVQTYRTGGDTYNGIMTIRELKNGISDE